MKKTLLVLTMVALLALLFGCSKAAEPAASSKSTSATAAAAAPVRGGTLILGASRPPVNFGYPQTITGPDIHYSKPFFEHLIKIDAGGNFAPELATSWDVAADGKSITFKLRQGVKFHDGTDFNADAVKFNYDPLLPPKTTVLVGVASIEKIDDYTVKFNLSSYNSVLFYSMVVDVRCCIASPAAIQKNGADWARTNPVGTGPFIFKSSERNVSITGERNPNYWDKGQDGKSLPYLDGIKWIAIADPMTQMTSFKAGELNVIFDARPESADQLKKEGFDVSVFIATIQCYSFDNNPDSVFANQKVREAMEYAIDKEAIMQGPGLGLYQTAYQIVPNGSAEYNTSCPARKYDVNKAKQLLTEAGYPNGFSFKLIVSENDFQALPTAVQGYLAKVGIKMDIEKMASAAFETQVRQGGKLEKNTAANMVIDYRLDALYTLNNYFTTSSAYYKFINRPAGIDALLSQALSAREKTDKIKIMQQVTKLVYDSATVMPIQIQPRLIVSDKKAQNVGFCQAGDCINSRWGYNAWLKP